MKIVSGLGCIDDYIRLVKAGADEVFVGMFLMSGIKNMEVFFL